MNDLVLYVKESYNELLHKVTWPTWPQLIDATKLVLVATVMIALVIFVLDVIAKFITTTLYSINF